MLRCDCRVPGPMPLRKSLTLGIQSVVILANPSEAGSPCSSESSRPACANNCLLGKLRSARARQQVGCKDSFTGRLQHCLSCGAYCYLHAIPHLASSSKSADFLSVTVQLWSSSKRSLQRFCCLLRPCLWLQVFVVCLVLCSHQCKHACAHRRTVNCRFSGLRIYPGRGIQFIRSDGSVRGGGRLAAEYAGLPQHSAHRAQGSSGAHVCCRPCRRTCS